MQTVRKNAPLVGFKYCLLVIYCTATGTRDEKEWLRNYKGKFFPFACSTAKSAVVQLSKIYRQTDTSSVSVLNNLRNNQIPQLMFRR
jgi:hypothetical protein